MSAKGPASGILTFLIADIRGYTTFTQQRGDEAAGRLAAKFADICREGIEAHGGELTELRGDEALAVFSSPRAALRAAADLQAVFADESAIDPELRLPVGVGLDAGEAVAVSGGYRGGALNLAARLCSKAAAGEVLVSQGVALLARAVDGIQLEDHGRLEMKGLSEPVQVFRFQAGPAISVTPGAVQEPPPELVSATPIFGRESELRRLRWMWRMARRGTGRVVAVAGPAGIGKTRLLAELAATVAAGGAQTTYRSFAVNMADELRPLTDGVAGLTVLDDLECAQPDDVRRITEQLSHVDSRVVALAFNDDESSHELLTAAHALSGSGEGFIRPQPLDIEQMLRIASLYVGSATDTLPQELLTATGGMPRKVHEAVSVWAHVQASRRLGVLANQAASDRGGLRAVEADLAGTVIDLQTVREQTRLYRVGPGRHAAEPAASPYRGLASFDVSDAEHFFGRERLVAELVARLAGAPLLGVIGPSGSGKSSAVRAGLIPALSMGVLPGSEKWTIALLRPGEHPLRAVEHAIYRSLPRATLDRMGAADAPLVAVRDALEPDTRLVLVIDQFEEAFTAVNDPAEREAFLAATAAAAADPRGGVVVILAIRADFYGRCAAHAGLAELLAANHVLVGPMTSAEYRRAIVQPALRVGVEVERELVDDLVGEVLGEPGALPLLSTTLLELWDRRDGRAIRRQAYLATGGVRGAVARLAEDVYGTFDEARQATARSILLRLAGPGEGELVVRRRVALAEFDAERNPTAAHVLEVFADRRLVTISDGTVEVAHEALLHEWPRLQNWLDEDREGRRLRQHLIAASRDWVDRGKDPGELYRGARLSAALDWTTEHTVELNEVERDFVTTSRAQSQSDLIRQRRQNRRLRGLLGGVAALLILALAAGGLALVQSRSAQDQARLALARQLGAEAVSAPRIDEAMLLAREAVLLDNSSQTKSTLLATLLRSPAVVGTFAMPLGLRPLALALSPDGGKLAVTENNGEIRFFDTATYRESGARLADYGGLPGGTVLYSGTHFIAPKTPSDGGTPTLDVFDSQTMHRIRSLQFTPDFVRLGTGPFDPVVTSADGNSVYLAWTLVNNDGSDGPAYVDSWNLISGAHRLVSLGANGIAAAAALPGNRLLVVTDSAVLTLDAATLHVLQSMPESFGPTLVAISPDGRTVAAATGASSVPGNTFVLLDLATGRRTLAGSVHTAPLDRLTFTPNGRSVVSTGEDARVVVWDASTGAPTQILNGHSGRVVGEATDGKTLYTSSLDGVVFAWDLGDTHRFGRPFNASSSGPLQLPPSLAPALALSPDSSRFGVRTGVGTVGIFDARTLTLTSTLAIGPDVFALAWSGDNQLAVATDAGAIQLWDVHATPTRGRDLSGVTGTIQAVAFSPNARTVAAVTRVRQPASSPGASAGELGIWDRASGRLLQQLHPGVTDLSVAFDPTGRRVAVGTGLGKVVVVDVSSGRNERTLNLATAAIRPTPVWAVAWNGPDTLLTGNNAGIVQHWDVRSGVAIGHAVLAEAAPVSSITVSPDGTLFATSGGSSGDLKIWDDSSLQQVGTSFPGSPGLWGSAAYTPNGSKLIVVYGDGSGTVWPVSLTAWMNHACAVAKRNFTREEWARFVPGHDYAQTCAQYPAGV